MPLGDGITFKYGDYEFSPRPLFTVNKEILKTPSNTGLATKYSLTLNGTILPTGIDLDKPKGGLSTVLSDTQSLRDAFAKDFELLSLSCDGLAPIISGYPKVMNIDVSSAADNYVRQATYTITLEMPTLIGARSETVGLEGGQGNESSLGLVSMSTDTSIEFYNERVKSTNSAVFNISFPSVFSITKNVSAQGDSLAATGTDAYIEPWERAQSYVKDELGKTGDFSDYFSGVMCIDGLNVTSTFRTFSVNHTDGSCAGTQTFIAYSGTDAAIEDFEGSVEQSNDTPFTSVTINGTIQGFDNIEYGDSCPPTDATTNKFEHANNKWKAVSGSLYDRATGVLNSTTHHNIRTSTTEQPLHLIPLSTSIGYNPIAGTITYSFSYNDRLDFIDSNAITEVISITHNKRPDLYASITILGRGSNGPLLQGLGATGPYTQDASVDVIYKPTSDYNTIKTVTAYDESLFKDPDNSFTTSDTETWDAAAGHYTRSKSWEIGSC